MKASRSSLLCAALSLAITTASYGQNATVSESLQSFRTYPSGDPNQVPRMGNIYPYFRFEGHSTTWTEQPWRVVTLENPTIRVLIAPEIGGKILGVFEKSTGRDFIYFNKVVKFREIAMRGPWTSGGIEFNFGDIGHAPTTSTPVDYLTRTNPDGSVSCFVGAMDLPSRTVWRVEIRLPKDKAYVETHSFWYNPTSQPTSLYHWMNAAAPAAPDLQFVYPGTAYIDHGGTAYDYPQGPGGRDISRYAQNAFGSHKSYHVLGSRTDFFGAYYTDRDFGVMHWARYEDKPGKKIWMWSQARDGEIWVDLLTDPELGNGQYVEIQSGLLFNQAGSSSTETPFKHQFLAPHSQERFSEAWFPVLKTGGVVEANLTGSLNLVRNGRTRMLAFCPVRSIDEELVVRAGDREVFSKKLRLRPLETYRTEFEAPENVDVTVTLGGGSLVYRENESAKLQRPAVAPDAYDWSSPTGLAMKGLELSRQRDFAGALSFFERCLEKDPFHIEALVMAAQCRLRRMEYADALALVKRALAIDAYDGGANFTYGLVSRRLALHDDARDGFAKAARTPDFRSAALTELAHIALLERTWDVAEHFAQRALAHNRYDMRARRVLALVYRITKRAEAAREELRLIEELDPLDHFVAFERYLHAPTEDNALHFTSGVRSELRHETFLELAVDYAELGLPEEAALVLELAPDQAIVSYWKAALAAKVGEAAKAAEDLSAALAASPALVFPHRSETVKVLEWAESQSPHWKTKYYLGLLAWNRGRASEASGFFASCGDQPDFAPFYLARATLEGPASRAQAERDLRRAVQIGPSEWRTHRALGAFYTAQGDYARALGVLSEAAKEFPSHDVILFDLAQNLLYNHRYDESLAILDTLTVLPFEGAGYSRQAYREACVLSALEMIKRKDYAGALTMVTKARQWPEHLGVGRPYDVDERIEDYLESYCAMEQGQDGRALLEKIASGYPFTRSSVDLISAAALRRLDRAQEGQELLRSWEAAKPGDPVALWSQAVYDNDRQKADQLLVGSASWYVFPHDPEFLLVSHLVKTVGTL